MLKEEQVSKLLQSCESIVGSRLEQIRGNLRNPESRSAAIWELLTLDACSALGSIEYEPCPEGSPDIRLSLPSGAKIWIEVAFLYPRFWKEERQSREISQWIREEANRRGVVDYRISCQFNGAASLAGFKRELPRQHEKKKFLDSAIIKNFFNSITAYPSESHLLNHPDYTLSISYSPLSNGGGAGGLIQEAPKHYKEHALYRIIKNKARQHDVSGVRILCIGSDQSNALSSMVPPGGVTASNAVHAAFCKTTSVSGVIVVNIENKVQPFAGITKSADARIYINDKGKAQLAEADRNEILKLNFNRWKYYYPLNKYETPKAGLDRKIIGTIEMTTSRNGSKLKIPSSILLEILVGRTTLSEEYGMGEDGMLLRLLSGDYRIKHCGFEEGAPEKGEDSKVIFELEADFDAIFDRVSNK